MTTHIALEGGTRDGTTLLDKGLDDDLSIYFDTAFEPRELYRRTEETRTVDGIEHIVFRFDPSA